MRLHEFTALAHKRMAEKGLGGKEITTYHGRAKVKDIVYCEEHEEFHLILED